MKKIKVDKTDLALLYELNKDCRQSLKGIAKKLRQSPQGIHYRIERLIKREIIAGFHTLVDSSLLGYQSFGLDLRLDGSQLEKDRFIEFLLSHKSVTLIERIDGKNDLSLTIMAKNTRECQKTVMELTDNFSNIIGNSEMVNVLGVMVYPRTHFIHGKNIDKVPIRYGMANGSIDIDETDRKILDALSADARRSTLEVSRITGVPAESVRRRIRKLRKEGVIVAHTVSMNFPKLGYQNYELLIKFRVMTSEKKKQIESYCASNPYVSFFIPLSGTYDAYVVFDCVGNEHFFDMVRDLRSKISGIADINASAVRQILKWRTFPEG